LCNLVADNFLSQLVSTPTHDNNILDLEFINCSNMFEVADGLPGADHAAFQDICKLHTCDHSLYNYKHADFSYFESVLALEYNLQ